MTRPDNSGFTLIELLVVLAIIAVLGGIATIRFAEYTKRVNDSAAAADAKNLLTMASVNNGR